MLSIVLIIAVLLLSLVMLVKGADLLVDGAADFARYLKISPILVGLTIVAFGTSLPEFVVSMFAVFMGSSDLSVGTVVGSNIANIGLVIGISSMIFPLAVVSKSLMYEFPVMIISSFVFLILADNRFLYQKDVLALNYIDGAIFWVIFVVFLFYIYKSARNPKESVLGEFTKAYKHKNSLTRNILYIIGGIAVLTLGGKLFVNSASDLARIFGMSEAFIGLTIAALGTSAPELFTCVVAAFKKEADIVVGNAVGSNIFNILFVLGTTSIIKTISVNPTVLYFDAVIMMFFSLLLLLFSYTSRKILRVEGGVLFGLYIGYILIKVFSL